MADINEHLASVEGRWGKCFYFKNDQHIGAALKQYGEYSPDETEFILRLAKKAGDDKITLDIGANIGVMAQALEYCGYKVEAFEPQPAVLEVLKMNVKGPVHGIALGDREGAFYMPIPDFENTYNYGSAELDSISKSRGGVRVPVKTLDSLGYNNIGVMKLDVEGFEELVLRGAVETIRRCKPVLYLEDDRPHKSESLRRFLDEIGYKYYPHVAPMFRRRNFFKSKVDIWGPRIFVSFNIVAYPA